MTDTQTKTADVLRTAAEMMLETGLTTEQEVDIYNKLQEHADELATDTDETDSLEGIGFENNTTDQPNNTLTEGDVVRDTDPETWMRKAGKDFFTVEKVTDVPAYDYQLSDKKTVADVNPLEPDTAPVIKVTRDDMSKTLAYPVTRLEKVE